DLHGPGAVAAVRVAVRLRAGDLVRAARAEDVEPVRAGDRGALAPVDDRSGAAALGARHDLHHQDADARRVAAADSAGGGISVRRIDRARRARARADGDAQRLAAVGA